MNYTKIPHPQTLHPLPPSIRNSTKTLILRLSSLGDIIMSHSALESEVLAGPIHWVTAQEYSVLFEGHPKITRVWKFDRNQGLLGWVRFCYFLWKEEFSQVLDLHRNLRTRIAKIIFKVLSFVNSKQPPEWKTVSKERTRLYGYYWFKDFWPSRWRPSLIVSRFAKLAGGNGTERPNLRHLIASVDSSSWGCPQEEAYICVMPDASFKGKVWAPEKYFEVLKNLSIFPVILGREQDEASKKLVSLLLESRLPHCSGIGKWNLQQNAYVISKAKFYLGNDTGFAHMAEALGVPALIVNGPSSKGMGYGPWKAESQSVGIPLWCRPCGIDGRSCHRLIQRHLCLSGLSSRAVLEAAKRMNDFNPRAQTGSFQE